MFDLACCTLENQKEFYRRDQIQRECRERGLTHPDTHGSFWRIEFAEAANAPSLARSPQLDPIAEPVQGPLALGFGCNEGLGLFVPVRDA